MATVVEDHAPERAQHALPSGPAADSSPQHSQTILVACAISAAAGAVHALAMVDHFGHYWLYGVFFLVVTYFQILWAIRIYRRPDDRRALAAGAIASIAISIVWLVSRTTGIPLGPDAGKPEKIGALDLVATVDQLVLVGLIASILTPDGWLGRRMTRMAEATTVRLGVMLCSASLFAMLLGGHKH